jgi:hypothetical protein
MASRKGNFMEGYMSIIDARSHDRRDMPIVWRRKGGVQRGLDKGRGKRIGRGYIRRIERRVVIV